MFPRALFLSLVLGCALTACRAAAAGRPPGQEQRVEVQRAAMGTLFRVVVHAADPVAARAAAERALDEVERVEAWASDWRADSEVRRMADLAEARPAGTPLALSAELAGHLDFALDVAAETGGAFDPTLGTLTRLWRRAQRQGELPSAARLAEARACAGWRRVALDPERRTLAVLAPGLRLDLGGSAKGEALDRALARLAEDGFPCGLVDGGGDLRLGAPPPGRAGWTISVRTGDGAPLALELASCAVATSGDALRAAVLGGVRYAHIVDPATGLGLTTARAATVIAPDGRTADALATALVGAGPDGLRWIEARPGVEARIAPGPATGERACVSSGFPQDGAPAPRGGAPLSPRSP